MKKHRTNGKLECPSDESPIPNTSPETKKSSSGELAVCFHEVSEQEAEEHVILYTLNMTEDFGDTLRNILKKLDKLDSIEKSFSNSLIIQKFDSQ